MSLSVVTVCYNDLSGLIKTYESLAIQESNDFEWVVVDGGSSDGTVEFLADIDCSFESVWVSEKDSGIYDAMNKGFKLSSAGHIIFLNAGDVFYSSNVVAKIYDFLKNNPESVIYGDYVMVCGKIEVERRARDVSYLNHSLPTSHQAMFYPRSFFSSNTYDLTYSVSSDYYYTCLAYKQGVSFIKVKLLISKFYTGGVSSINKNKVAFDMFRVQRDVMKLSFLYRVFSFFRRFINMSLASLLSKI